MKEIVRDLGKGEREREREKKTKTKMHVSLCNPPGSCYQH